MQKAELFTCLKKETSLLGCLWSRNLLTAFVWFCNKTLDTKFNIIYALDSTEPRFKSLSEHICQLGSLYARWVTAISVHSTDSSSLLQRHAAKWFVTN